LPTKTPVTVPWTFATEMITSEADVLAREGPIGVVVAAWLLRTADWSKGLTVLAPENSQITAVPAVPLGLGLMVTTVAPDFEFLAYHKSAIEFEPASSARALPAST
jgi:hypothetical protein